MTRSIALFFLGLFYAAPVLACTLQTDTERPEIPTYVSDGLICLEQPPANFRFDPSVERAFIEKINFERSRKGLNPLSVRRALLPAARYQSLDMGVNSFFDHQSPDGRRASDRIAAFDRTLLAQSTGENIAVFGPARCYDQNDREVSCLNLPGFKLPTPAFVAEDLHQKLMDSEGHRANIMSEDYTHVAIGVARTDTGFYVTQVFANRIGQLSAPLPTKLETNSALLVVNRFERPIPAKQGVGLARKIAGDIACALYQNKQLAAPYFFSSDADVTFPKDYFNVDFNTSKKVDEYVSKPWNTLYDIKTYTESIADDNSHEGLFKGKSKPVFPYNIPNLKEKNGDYDIIKAIPTGNTMTVDFAKAAIIGENLGKSDYTDFLAISFSSPDYIGHQFGVASKEIQDNYLRLDKDLADLFSFLDKEVGKNNYTLFLTADTIRVYNDSLCKLNKKKKNSSVNFICSFFSDNTSNERFGSLGHYCFVSSCFSCKCVSFSESIEEAKICLAISCKAAYSRFVNMVGLFVFEHSWLRNTI